MIQGILLFVLSLQTSFIYIELLSLLSIPKGLFTSPENTRNKLSKLFYLTRFYKVIKEQELFSAIIKIIRTNTYNNKNNIQSERSKRNSEMLFLN